MNNHSKCIDGIHYPEFHPGWGGCAEELFHYTSRYIACTEAFLRNLADQRQFSLSGYQAGLLSDEQRRLLAAVLAGPPDRDAARAITQLVRCVVAGESRPSESLVDQFREQLKTIPEGVTLVYANLPRRTDPADVAPLDPFLNLATRLSLPVAVHGHHLEVELKILAQHLDSANVSLRNSLQEAILKLHFAGYQLKNHPGLTHRAARQLGHQDSAAPKGD
ncbi:MAG: endonuclease [Candidatus Thiodiazotropha sp.]